MNGLIVSHMNEDVNRRKPKYPGGFRKKSVNLVFTKRGKCDILHPYIRKSDDGDTRRGTRRAQAREHRGFLVEPRASPRNKRPAHASLPSFPAETTGAFIKDPAGAVGCGRKTPHRYLLRGRGIPHAGSSRASGNAVRQGWYMQKERLCVFCPDGRDERRYFRIFRRVKNESKA